MRRGRTALTLGAIGLAGVLALSGCGRADDAATGDAEVGSIDDSPATGDITIWAMGEEGENLGAFSKTFTDANPDANVTVTTIPWADVMTKYQTAVAAGTVPDAIMIGSSFLPAMVAAGGLAAVPDGVVDTGTLNETAADSTVVDGVSYAVPWYVETRVLYYRSDLAKAAGMSAPTTWKELSDFATGFKNAGAQYGIQLPMGDAEDSTQVIMPFYAQAGALCSTTPVTRMRGTTTRSWTRSTTTPRSSPAASRRSRATATRRLRPSSTARIPRSSRGRGWCRCSAS